MSDTVFAIAVLIVLMMGLVASKGTVWLSYKLYGLKRFVWTSFGVCPKCNQRMSRTGSGRLVCTNGHCRK